jgi:hypothetical protein
VIGGAVRASSLVVCYVVSGGEEAQVIYLWVVLQIFWLMLRSVFVQFSQGTNTMIYPVLAYEELEKLQANSKRMILNLAFALARHQTHTHPRGSYLYEEDLLASEQMDNLLSQIPYKLQSDFPMNLLSGSGSTIAELSFYCRHRRYPLDKCSSASGLGAYRYGSLRLLYRYLEHCGNRHLNPSGSGPLLRHLNSSGYH